MIVIADTSPLHYLILIQVEDVLPRLFQRVLIPDEVYAELRHPGAPAAVRQWIAEPPPWLEIQSAATAPDAIADLDAGEAAAIRLAEQLGETAFLLMDDLKGGASWHPEHWYSPAFCRRHPKKVISFCGMCCHTYCRRTSTSRQPWCSPS